MTVREDFHVLSYKCKKVIIRELLNRKNLS